MDHTRACTRSSCVCTPWQPAPGISRSLCPLRGRSVKENSSGETQGVSGPNFSWMYLLWFPGDRRSERSYHHQPVDLWNIGVWEFRCHIVDGSGRDDLHRRQLCFHGAYLHGRGVGLKTNLAVCRMCPACPGRMVRGVVEGLDIVYSARYRAFRHAKQGSRRSL